MITALEIARWCDRIDARHLLSELVLRLICASLDHSDIQYIRVPTAEATGLSGWDGILECSTGNTWIPTGRSVWELGTGQGAVKKIKGDWKRRTDTPNLLAGWSPENVTFVAVTGRIVNEQESLRQELNAGKSFQNLRILDGEALKTWIFQSPGVDLWLRKRHNLGPPVSLKYLPVEAESWQATRPAISPDLLLAGRETNGNTLLQALQREVPKTISILADSPEEAVAFIAAVLKAAIAQEPADLIFWKSWHNRTLVCHDSGDLDSITGQSPLLLILKDAAIAQAHAWVGKGHTVITVPGNDMPGKKPDITLMRPNRKKFSRALVDTMGMEERQAEVEARACSASVSVWRIWNMLETNCVPKSCRPIWGGDAHPAILCAILLGGWDDRCPGDRALIERCIGTPFAEFRDKLSPFARCDIPLIQRSGSVTTISGAATAFALMVGQMNTGHLEKFAQMAKTVFAEQDPLVDIPPAERHLATLRGQELSHSEWVRNGLAGTALRIAVLGERLTEAQVVPDGLTHGQFINRIIRELPGLAQDWRLMTSLRDQLPVLMEAAPHPFLDALERLLQGDATETRMALLFQESWSGGSFMPGLLWGLEGLAWDPELLPRVVRILAALHSHDPGGTLSNRPMNTLRDIFLAWYPGTLATVPERLALLEALMERQPEVGRQLLQQLLPSHYATSCPTHLPAWRPCGGFQRPDQIEVQEAYGGYIQMALRLGCSRPDLLCSLLKGYGKRALAAHRTHILEVLDTLWQSDPAPAIREQIGNTLRQLVGRHTQFAGADWAMPEAVLSPLRERMARWASTDATRFDWLFNEAMPDSPIPPAPGVKARDTIFQQRREAVAALWQEGQWPILRSLIHRVREYYYVVEPVAAQLTGPEEGLAIVQELADGSRIEQLFASALSGRLRHRFGDDWLDLLYAARQCWTPAYLAGLCTDFVENRRLMAWLATLGSEVEEAYWRSKEYCCHRESDLEPDWVVGQLLKAGRSWYAVNYIHSVGKNLSPDRVMEVLRACLQAEDAQLPVSDYEIGELFAWLRQHPDVDLHRLVALEYAYLPLLATPRGLGEETAPLALHRGLAQDPELFVQIMCDVYKPDSAAESGAPPSADAIQRADLGWELLSSWCIPPGVREDGTVDEHSLQAWVERARTLAREKERLEVADTQIGQVLCHFPSDPDDAAWPHQALRKLLETVANEKVEQGILIGKYNARGITSRAPDEGGEQERQLADKWRGEANTVGTRWPRTQALLRRMADAWEHDATVFDQHAEQWRLRWNT